MADEPQTTTPDPIVIPGAQPTVYSPSPTPGEPAPKRRAEDTKTYTFEWTTLLIAVLTWGTTFLAEVSTYETWAELQTPKVVGLHLGQLIGTVVAVLAAKRIK